MGVAAALVATVATFFLIGAVFQIAPVQRELLEARTALARWPSSSTSPSGSSRGSTIDAGWSSCKARVWAAAATGSTMALFGVGFTAVYREGFETALFYQALFGSPAGWRRSCCSASPLLRRRWASWRGPCSGPGAASRSGCSSASPSSCSW